MLIKSLKLMTISLLAFYVAAVLFGAPFFSKIFETLEFATVLSLLTTLPMCFVTCADSTTITELVFELNPSTKAQFYVLRSTIGTILGAWLGAFVIPLDWDRWWQVWPLPCLFGCFLGFTFGLLEAFIELQLSITQKIKFAPKYKAF